MATRSDMIIDQGSTFSTVVTVTDTDGSVVNLTGYTANSQIRKHATSSGATATFGISNGGTNGQLTLSLAHANTSAITAGRYVYDVEVTSGANVRSRVVEGIVTVTPEITR
tara:strand:+ start:1200 stop:1532 length:333 start_codon:yes stop_codon:yes gene_type:complete